MKGLQEVSRSEHNHEPLDRASTSNRLYRPAGRSRGFIWAVVATLAVVVGAIVVLAAGGDGGANDPTGDVRLVKGKQPRDAGSVPIAASVADIAEADVRSQNSEIVFEVRTAADIPSDFERSSLEFRFDVAESRRPTWIVTASVNVSPTAALVSQTTDYTATTIDGSLPGEVEISGRSLTITLDRSGIEGFPESFEWALTSKLIAFRDITGSTRAEDRFPDEGSVGF